MTVVMNQFQEFIEENVKEVTKQMPWMDDRTFACCENMAQLSAFIDKAIDAGKCVVDLETTGLNTRLLKDGTSAAKLVGICLSFDSRDGLYVPTGHQEGAEFNLPEAEVLKELKRLCANCIIIFHNAKYDVAILLNYGIVIDDFSKMEDTQILARLYDAGQKNIQLKQLSGGLLGQKMITFEEVSGKNKRFDMVSPKIGYVYGCCDAVCTLDLYNLFMASSVIQEQKSVYNLEKRVCFVVMQMERNLIKIDVEKLRQMKVTAEKREKEIESEIYRLAGKEFNIASPIQLGKILFEELGYDYPLKTKSASGQWTTDTATLEKIQSKYPIVSRIVEYRELGKSLGTYINNLLANHDEDHCIKLGFKQTGTDTGRFSSPGGRGINEDGYSGINVQSLPKGETRRVFLARPGYKLVAMDYSNEEMRVAANLSKEKVWIDAFLSGADLHEKSGQIIYGREKISKEERGVGKCVVKGTLIATQRGWLPIEEITTKDKVISHTGALKKVTSTWNMGKKAAIRLCTSTGHTIECGVNHRFLTEDNKWVKAADLEKGLLLKTSSCEKMGFSAEVQKVHFNFWDKGNNNFSSPNLPFVEINRHWAKLIGYVLGDGSMHSKAVRICCSPQYDDVKKDIVKTAEVLGLPVNATLRHRTEAKNPLWTISLGSTILARFFKHIGFLGRHGKIFRVPRIIFESPKSVQAAFLRGLYETDGTVEASGVSVTTKDKDLAEDIILLLAGFGIKAYHYVKRSKRYRRDYYTVRCAMEGTRKFAMQIGFISGRKKEKLRKLVSKPKGVTSGSYRTKWLTEVASVERIGNMELMDLTVQNDHTYIAEGLVTHNTVNFGTLYGAGPRRIAEVAKCSETEAKRIQAAFFAGLPSLKKWIDNEIRRARRSKRVTTVFGRVRPLAIYYNSPDRGMQSHGDRCVCNTLIQGGCADIMKTAMVRAHNWIYSNGIENDCRMLITMHDEIVYEIKEDRLADFIPVLNKIMCMRDVLQDMLHWDIPLSMDAEYGDTWYADCDFFKEHPELRDVEDVKFHTAAPVGRYAMAQKNIETDSTNVTPPPVNETVKEEPAVEEKVVETSAEPITESQGDTTGSILEQISPDTDLKTADDVLGIENNDDILVYTLRDRRKSTARLVNQVIMFLTDETASRVPYEAPKKQIVLKDFEGNSLLISEIKINADAFLSLARYLGL